MPGIGIGLSVAIKGNASRVIPNLGSALFWMDGTLSGSEFVDKSGNNRNFTITGKDFTGSYFPYKSAATISAPPGDAVLFAADVNSFLYGVDADSPNEIPITSLFQNIDYENIGFARHVTQSVNGNGVEIIEPHVKDFSWYDSALTGSDLIMANSYYTVPVEQTVNVQWVAKDGNDTTGDGSKSLPWLTLGKGFTEAGGTDRIYVRTGEYAEKIIVNANLELFGLGLVLQNPADYCLYASADITITASHFYFERDDNIAIRAFVDYTGTWTFNNCKVDGIAAFYKTTGSNGILTLNNCVIDGKFTTNLATLNLNTILWNDAATGAMTLYNDLVSTNSKYKNLTAASAIETKQTGFSMNFLGDDINEKMIVDAVNAYDGTITFEYCTFTALSGIVQTIINSTGVVDVSFKYCTVNSDGTVATLINFTNPGDFVFENNTVNEVNGGINLKGSAIGQIASFKTNTFQSDTGHNITVNDFDATVENNILNSEISSKIVVSCVDVNVGPATIKNNVIISKTSAGSGLITLGTYGTLATYGYMNGSVIENNIIFAPQYFGNSSAGVHALFVISQNCTVRYNYIIGSFLGVVLKFEDQSAATTFVYGNIIVDCEGALLSKGTIGATYYNNTVVWNAVDMGYGVKAQFDDLIPGSYSDYTIIKNNIFVDNFTAVPSQGAINFEHASDYANSESDYNTIYSKNGDYIGTLVSTDYDLAGWQGQGFGTNSQDLTALQFAALFTNYATKDFSLPVGSAAIGAAETLAASYDDDLDASTVWGTGATLPVIVTKQQTAPWDVGAYVS